MDGSLSIGEVSRRTGVPASTLRYYERVALLPRPRRASGQRRYGEEVILQIALIQLARQVGFNLWEVHELFGDFSDPLRMGRRFRAMSNRKLAEIDALIDSAQRMKALLEEGLRSDCLTLQDCTILTAHLATFPEVQRRPGSVSTTLGESAEKVVQASPDEVERPPTHETRRS